MNPDLKKKLLERMFSSSEYMRQMGEYFDKALERLNESLEWFEKNPPQDVDWESWHISNKPEGWRKRAVPNLNMLSRSIWQGIEEYENGDPDRIRGTSNNIMALSRDMDVLGEKWWDYVPLDIARKFGVNLGKAEQMASNIYRTLGGGFAARPGTITDEEVTGPIDEQELLKYLKPGERP